MVHERLREALAEVGVGEGGAELGEAILGAVPDAVLPVDQQGTIVLANAAVQGLTGHAAADLVGRLAGCAAAVRSGRAAPPVGAAVFPPP